MSHAYYWMCDESNILKIIVLNCINNVTSITIFLHYFIVEPI